MDEKFQYIAKTLSRTKRKDYENYVVNAIWNRLYDDRLYPVTQQYIRTPNGDYYFIDLYFPQLKIGIECDESHHLKQKLEDAEREVRILDVLRQIETKEYVDVTRGSDDVEKQLADSEGIILRVDVTKPFKEIEDQINTCVKAIQKRAQELQITDGWEIYQPDVVQYFRDKEYITIYDDVAFHTNREVYNTILGQDYKNPLYNVGVSWTKLYTKYGYEEGLVPFFPELKVKTDDSATANGYINTLSKDGMEIREYNKDQATNENRHAEGMFIGQKRVVFVKGTNRVTGNKEYRFAGIFQGDHYENDGVLIYRRIDDKFKIVRI